MTVSFTWPIASTPHSASQIWGWVTIALAVLNFVILGGFFLLDVIPYLRHKKGKPALFGLSFMAVGFTAGSYSLVHGIQMINMSLTPTGPKPIDMFAVAGCFTPLSTFGWQRIRNLRGLPDHYWSGPRVAVVLIIAGAFASAFVTRAIDVTRFHHYALTWRHGVAINIVLGLTYAVISGFWLRYQWATRTRNPYGWNAIGASLGLVFFQFAFTRFAVALLLAAGAYVEDASSRTLYLVINIVSLVTAAIFLIVAISLLRRSEHGTATH